MDSLRFGFGENWKGYLSEADERSINQARQYISKMFGSDGLAGRRFLDAGCGSGIFSLAAVERGADVVSFDYDQSSVECAMSLKSGNGYWDISRGSLLDDSFMSSLGLFDVVFCWGVAHHTGDMWHALENIAKSSASDVLVSIYNDQGSPSRRWDLVKRLYNKYRILRPILISSSWVRLWAVKFVADTLKGDPLRRWRTNNGDERGMSAKRDLIDWVGGYPFEVAKPEQIFHFFRDRGFDLLDMTTQAGGNGCNVFHFRRR